jgi:hypothetical protein
MDDVRRRRGVHDARQQGRDEGAGAEHAGIITES